MCNSPQANLAINMTSCNAVLFRMTRNACENVPCPFLTACTQIKPENTIKLQKIIETVSTLYYATSRRSEEGEIYPQVCHKHALCDYRPKALTIFCICNFTGLNVICRWPHWASGFETYWPQDNFYWNPPSKSFNLSLSQQTKDLSYVILLASLNIYYTHL